MKKLTLITILLMIFATLMFAQENQTKAVVAIAGFDVKGVSEDEANVLFEVFISEFAGLGKCKVVDRSSVDKIKEQHQFQNSDWSNSEKVAKLGNALNANMVITGQLMLFKDTLVGTFRMLDVNSMEIVATATERVKDTNEFFMKLNDIAKKLVKSIASNDSDKDYQIGDIGPGGGYIFYVSEVAFPVHQYQPDGSTKMCKYLEVSPLELGQYTWCSCRDKSWCNVSTSDGLGAGVVNTLNILTTKHRNGISISNCAAYACLKYYTGTTEQGDWYLPSKMELDLLYRNLRDKIINTGSSGYHWSSSECYNDGAWGQRFSDGYQGNLYKSNTYSVRAIRAF